MTAFEIISVFIGVLALLLSFGSLLIALLAFLDKRNDLSMFYMASTEKEYSLFKG